MFRIQDKLSTLAGVLLAGLICAKAVDALEPPPVFELQWGSGGSLPGQFDNPWDVAVDETGFVYVSDSRNNRIQKFNSAGQFLLQWGQGGGSDSLYVPTGLATHGAHVYVWDAGNHVIKRFNQEGVFVDGWEDMADVSGYLAIDTSGTLFAASQDGTVNVFSSTGAYSHSFDVATSIRDIVVSSTGNLFIVEFRGEGRIFEYDASGTPVSSFPLISEATTEFISGWGLGSLGAHLYVSGSYYPSQVLIQKYSETGQLLSEWSVGANRGVGISNNEEIYVVRAGSDARVEKYSYQPIVGTTPTSWGNLKRQFVDQENRPDREKP